VGLCFREGDGARGGGETLLMLGINGWIYTENHGFVEWIYGNFTSNQWIFGNFINHQWMDFRKVSAGIPMGF
jgi:hypothetical protein